MVRSYETKAAVRRPTNRLAIAACVVLAPTLLLGCAEATGGYRKAFSGEAAPGERAMIWAPRPKVWDAVQKTLVKQGFLVQQADPSTGLIKATRDMEDPKNPLVSYVVNAVVTISPGQSADATEVRMAANQQTVLHRKWHDWWHLLWIVPVIPTGTEYQTVVTHEGDVKAPSFYGDFFDALRERVGTKSNALANGTNPAAGEAALQATSVGSAGTSSAGEAGSPAAHGQADAPSSAKP